jgi:DNA-binding SARP family transcriptional activator
MPGAATQRRTLALLALLAVAGDAGLSRDKLIGLLWPESDPERARHSLTQALYVARRALNDDALFVASASHVRLDSARLDSDVRAFEAALDAGRLEDAIALYEGPFVDGFFLSGSHEFEQWSSAQRDRLQARATAAIEELATRAEESGDAALAVRWRRRLAALLPLDSSSTVKLMTALAAAGDRAGAIQQARLHTTLLREELALEPDSAVEALAAQLRSSGAFSAEASDVMHDRASEAQADIEASDVEPVEDVHAIVSPFDELTVRPRDALTIQPRQLSIPLWTRWTIIGAVVFVLVSIGVLIGRGRRPTPADVRPLAARQRVVVAPFRVAGATPSLAYLRDGIVELLSTRLADDTAARSVDAGAVLGAWRAANLSPDMDVPRDTVVKLATRLGAERVVVGSIVGTPARVVLSASALALPAGTVTGEASVIGPADSISALVDRLAARLLVSEAGQDDELSHYISRSLPAIRSFLEGQAAFRRGDYQSAIGSYHLALRRDSSFALAALYEAMSANRIRLEVPLRVGVSLAWQSRDELSERDKLRLEALAGPRYPAPSTRAELDAAAQRLAELEPNNGAAAAEVENARLPSLQAQWRSAVARGDSATLQRLRTSMPRWDARELRALAMTSQAERIAPEDGARALALLATRSASLADRVDRTLAEHSLALNEGHVMQAVDATARLRRLEPRSHAWLRLRVLDGLYGDGDTATASAAAKELADASAGAPADDASASESWLADACVLAQWRLARGDTTQIDVTVARLRGWSGTTTAPAVSAAPAACAELLDATLAVVARREDARARVERLDSLAFTPQVAGDLHLYSRLAVARLFERLGAVPHALRTLRTAAPSAGWPRYLSASERYEATLAKRIGDTTSVPSASAR